LILSTNWRSSLRNRLKRQMVRKKIIEIEEKELISIKYWYSYKRE
jgi:hypothetical protein